MTYHPSYLSSHHTSLSVTFIIRERTEDFFYGLDLIKKEMVVLEKQALVVARLDDEENVCRFEVLREEHNSCQGKVAGIINGSICSRLGCDTSS